MEQNKAQSKLLVITPARNEEGYINKTLKSIVNQTILPREWIIVDDGSTDKTATIVEEYTKKYGWIKLVKKNDRGYREVGYGAVESLYCGIANAEFTSFEYLSLIDADIELEKEYFEILINKFNYDKKLGIASGKVYEVIEGRLKPLMLSSEMVAGAVKTWRRECFEDIDGLVEHMGWDGIDCYKAMMKGWQTRAFPDKELQVIHLRQLGTSYKSVFYAFAQRGKGMHFMGTRLSWLFASALFHIFDRPYILGSLFMMKGYLQQFLMVREVYNDTEFVQWLRKYQLRKLINSLSMFIK